ncbi:MAG: hypothetical protein KF855_15090 [Acidobacteria bacterium]|nr:hypothetical protein [Acidobacteriota bacterium]
MNNRAYLLILVLIAAAMAGACSGPDKPATPLETLQTYTKAMKRKDLTAMKLLLSADSIKMYEAEAKSQGVPLDEIIKREALVGENQKTFEFKDEKIDEKAATIEVKNSFGNWETIYFVNEDDQWKIDKKGSSERMIREIEELNRQRLDDAINQGRQDPDPMASPTPIEDFPVPDHKD